MSHKKQKFEHLTMEKKLADTGSIPPTNKETITIYFKMKEKYLKRREVQKKKGNLSRLIKK